MAIVKRLYGRVQQFHEAIVGRFALLVANRVQFGPGCQAGYGLRLRAVMGGQIHIGVGVTFDRWVDIFAHQCKLEIGNNCHFGKGCVIAAREGITIGSGCQIAEHVTIRDQDHRVVSDLPIMGSGYDTAPVTIGSHVWIGAGAVVTKGTSIGERAIIGAGAVVTRDVAAGSFVGGVPARDLIVRNGNSE